MFDVDLEARVLGKYLLGSEPDERSRKLYAHALDVRPICVDARDQALCSVAIGRSWLLGPLDAALALRRPASALRQKLTLMAAILETQPAYAQRFLSREPSRFGLARAGFAVARAATRAVVGLALLALMTFWK